MLSGARFFMNALMDTVDAVVDTAVGIVVDVVRDAIPEHLLHGHSDQQEKTENSPAEAKVDLAMVTAKHYADLQEKVRTSSLTTSVRMMFEKITQEEAKAAAEKAAQAALAKEAAAEARAHALVLKGEAEYEEELKRDSQNSPESKSSDSAAGKPKKKRVSFDKFNGVATVHKHVEPGTIPQSSLSRNSGHFNLRVLAPKLNLHEVPNQQEQVSSPRNGKL